MPRAEFEQMIRRTIRMPTEPDGNRFSLSIAHIKTGKVDVISVWWVYDAATDTYDLAATREALIQAALAFYDADTPVERCAFGETRRRSRGRPRTWCRDHPLVFDESPECVIPSNMDFDCCTDCKGCGVDKHSDQPCTSCGGTGNPEACAP